MKLRLRSLQSKETIKLEVPNDCNFQQLKETLNSALSPSSSLHFSLNRKDELVPLSPQDSLQSLGITSGDLIYFTQNPDGNFQKSAQDLTIINETLAQSMPVTGVSVGQRNGEEVNSKESEAVDLSCLDQETLEKVQDFAFVNCMELDSGSVYVDLRISEPYFLKRVLREEEFGDDFSDNKLLFIAIHAVFLESGFVGFDSTSGLRVDIFHFLQEQPLMNFTTSVSYTAPELLESDNCIESVVLRFQSLGQFVNVYGSLANSQSQVYRSRLDKCRFVPSIGSIWANWDKSDRACDDDSYTKNVVFELWKIVKDQLALPLLIDLCEKAGLGLPPCLMRLPSDLKLKILELLPGIDFAKMACVCKEMQYLSSNNDLWKRKFEGEFGGGTASEQMINWKVKFASCWENKKKRKRRSFVRPFPVNAIRSEPYRFIVPQPPLGGRIIGGDYDRLPDLGVPPPFIQHGRVPRNASQRNVIPNCNLGGFNA